MDKITLAPLLELIHSISKEIIQKYYRDEVNLFNPVWEVMKGHISKWKKINPEGWSFAEPKNKLMTRMGFARPSQMAYMNAPGIIAMTAGVLWIISSMEYKPEKKDIERFIDDCSKILKISSSLINNLKESLVLLCMKEMPNILKILKKDEIEIKKEEKKYVIYSHKNRKGNPITESEYLVQKEIDNSEYIIWMDKKNKDLFIKGKRPENVYPEERRALACLIKNIGNILFYKPLYEAIHDIGEITVTEWDNRRIELMNDIYKCISSLVRHCPEIKEFISTERGDGYKLDLPRDKNYCLIERLSPKIS